MNPILVLLLIIIVLLLILIYRNNSKQEKIQEELKDYDCQLQELKETYKNSLSRTANAVNNLLDDLHDENTK